MRHKTRVAAIAGSDKIDGGAGQVKSDGGTKQKILPSLFLF
jgi:hypothetical protein